MCHLEYSKEATICIELQSAVLTQWVREHVQLLHQKSIEFDSM